MLVRHGLLAVLVPLNVSGFRLVLARGWHATDCFVLKPACAMLSLVLFPADLHRCVR
jgi:hypothetical protein